MTNTENMQTEVTSEAANAVPQVTDAAEMTDDVPKATEEPQAAQKPESELMIHFSIEVPNDKIEKDFDEALLKYAGEIKLPGFRQGKVPLDVIKRRFKEAIQDEVIHKVMEKAVFEKIETDKIKIASQPKIDTFNYEEGKDLHAEVSVEVFPTVEIPDLETLEVEIPASELTYEAYDEHQQIDALLEGNKRQSPVISRPIQADDYVTIKYQSKIRESKKMTPQKEARVHVKENEPFEIPDLDKELIGKKADESLVVTRTYPAEFHKKPWAGKEVDHSITILNVLELVKPEFNQAFLKSVGFEDEASFKAKLKEEYESYNQKAVEDRKVKHAIDQLEQTLSFPVPDALVEEEAAHIFSDYQQRFNLPPMDPASVLNIEPVRKNAEKSLRVSLIMDALKKKYAIDATTDELEEQYKTIAEANHWPLKEVRKFYMNKENSQHLKEKIVREKITNLIREKIKIKEV